MYIAPPYLASVPFKRLRLSNDFLQFYSTPLTSSSQYPILTPEGAQRPGLLKVIFGFGNDFCFGKILDLNDPQRT